jgi:hypothetical protein
VVTDLGVSERSAACHLSALKLGGYARCEGKGTVARWYAAGTKPPECQWGLNANSLVGITNGAANWRESLPKAYEARWGKRPSMSSYQPEKIVVQRVRERAPAKTVQVPTLADLASSLIGPP